VSWDNACFPGAWTDQFLSAQAASIKSGPCAPVAQCSPSGILRVLNRGKAGARDLGDTIAFLSTHNTKNVLLFKSCDGGGTWTATHDVGCASAPATLGSEFGDLGFLPYATFSADAPTIPVEFTDVAGVAGGHQYIYTLVAESRGARFVIANGDSVAPGPTPGDTICVKNCRAEVLDLEPVLFNSLSSSSANPNVARVYLPISRQSGEFRATIAVTDSAGAMRSSRLELGVTDDSVADALYRVRFADSARALEVKYFRGTKLLKTTTHLVLRVPASQGDSVVINGTNRGGISIGGAAAAPVIEHTPPQVVTVISGDTATLVDSLGFAWATGPVMALARQGGSVTALSDPLLASSSLVTHIIPGSFLGSVDYPRFNLSVDKTLLDAFAGETFLGDSVTGRAIGPLVAPTVAWSTTGASKDTVNSLDQANGVYRLAWSDYPYGHGDGSNRDEFRLNFSAPGTSVAQIAASITGRTVGATGDSSAATAAAIATSLGQPSFIADSLVRVKVPFAVYNQSYGRPVTVAMRRRTFGSVLIGVLPDTLRVPVPVDAWVPGDTLFFLEKTGIGGGGALAVTFRRAVISCDPARFVRVTCNPVYPGTRGADNSGTGGAYLGEQPGNIEVVEYATPVTPVSQFTVHTIPPRRGAALTGDTAVKSGLAAVKVVPNPYIEASSYVGVQPNGQNFGQALMFTHMPPRGVLRIYTVAGQFVQQISWTEADLNANGDLAWNLRTREGNQISAGLFLYVLTAQDATGKPVGSVRGKFVVIR
jgi:hypothetical protein